MSNAAFNQVVADSLSIKASAGSSAVIVQRVSKSFGNENVLKEVSLGLEKGKIHGIIGRNGSGKTVLMKCICGFLRPTSGAVNRVLYYAIVHSNICIADNVYLFDATFIGVSKIADDF